MAIKVILAYCNYPGQPGTAYYYERALRVLMAPGEVKTLGFNNDIHTADGQNPYPALEDMVCSGALDLDDDCTLLEVESGGFDLGWRPDRLEAFFNRVWVGIDSHLSLVHHQEKAHYYDHVFIAQKLYLPQMREHNGGTQWLPLACDPEIHGGGVSIPPVKNSAVFVGSMHPGVHGRRIHLMQYLKECNTPVETFTGVWGRQATDKYTEHALVLNCSLSGDLNMRWFEGLASGRMLITDMLPVESGVMELLAGSSDICRFYTTWEHCGTLINEYVNNFDTCKAVAAVAQAWVYKNHTYGHRVKTVLETVYG